MLKKLAAGSGLLLAMLAFSPARADLQWSTPEPTPIQWHNTMGGACQAWAAKSPQVQEHGVSNAPQTGPIYVRTMFLDFGNYGYGYNGTHCALYMPTCIASPELCATPEVPAWFNSTYHNWALVPLVSRPEPEPPVGPTPPPECRTCKGDPGAVVANPIVPATGEKIQTDVDYVGTGPHALSLVRTYRSHRLSGPIRGSALSGLGNTWSHNHTVAISYTGTPGTASYIAKVQLGDGTERWFYWNVSQSAWVPRNSVDTLTPGAGGWLYKRADDDSSWQFNANNRVVTRTERNGWVTTYAYDPAYPDRLASVTNHFGRAINFFHLPDGKLYNLQTPDGQVIQYDVYGICCGSSSYLSNVWYPGNLPGDARSVRSYVYEGGNLERLTRIVDEMGTNPFAQFGYDAQGRAISSTHAGNAGVTTVAYGTSSATVTDALGKARVYTYGLARDRLEVTSASDPSAGPSGNAVLRVQDLNGQLSEEIDFQGVRTTYSWDAGRWLLLSKTEAAGTPQARTTSTQWHPTWRLPLLVTEPGRATAYTYDAVGNKLTETVTDTATGATRTWAWTYNAQQLVETETGPSGGVTQYAYDNYGQVTSITNPLGHVTSLAYNTKGQLTQSTAPNGLVTTYTYDQRGRVRTITAGGIVLWHVYRRDGQLEVLASPEIGYAITYTYDAAARLTGWTDNRGSSAVYTLDAMGNRTAEQLKDGNTVVWQLARTINNLNRVTSETVGAGGTAQSETFGYNANGDLTSQTNGLSQSTSYGLDGLKRITAITNAANATANLSYNGLDAVTGASDFKGASTTYNRNAFGEATQESSADAGTRVTAYDGQGLPTQVVDALNQATTIQRDLLGRPTQMTFQDGKVTALRYDLTGSDYNAPGAPNASKGYLSEIEDRSGITKWQRDILGRVTRKVQTLASGASHTIQYSYNSQGLLDTLTYPGGGALKHLYTAQGHLSALQWNGQNLVTGITWNAAGQPTGWTWAFNTPIPVSRTYDLAGRLTANDIGSWSYDAAGRITSLTQSLGQPADSNPLNTSVSFATVTFTVGYDAVGRITSFADNQGNSTAFTYDANGNRLTSTEVKGSTTIARTYSVDPAGNKLLGFTQLITGPSGTTSAPVSYTYNANGEMTGNGLAQYGFNPENRLSSVTIGNTDTSPTTRYAHNALGQRVFKTEPLFEDIAEQPGDTGFWASLANFFARFWSPQAKPAEQVGWGFAYDEDGTLLGEYGTGGPNSTGSSQYIWLPTPSGPMPIAAVVNGTKYAVHADHLNTPRKLTNASGQAAWQWKYSAFGDEQPTLAANRFVDPNSMPGIGSGTVAAVTYNLRYPGQYADGESGLNYNYFRSYDAKTGRYNQSDPVGLGGGWNRYAYVDGDSLSNSDPLGLASVNGGTAAQRARLKNLLEDLEKKLEEATCKCPEKAAKIKALFDRWVITISIANMPEDSDGYSRARTANSATTFYANSSITSLLLAHEFTHTMPQNINKRHARGGHALLDHSKRPWETEAREFEKLLVQGSDICSIFTGEPVLPSPVEDYFRNYDYRPTWRKVLDDLFGKKR